MIEIGHREVELLISVEITERHPERSQRGGKVGMGLEGAVALAQADGDRIVVLVGRGDIGYTVSDEVSTSNRYRSGLLWNVITYTVVRMGSESGDARRFSFQKTVLFSPPISHRL